MFKKDPNKPRFFLDREVIINHLKNHLTLKEIGEIYNVSCTTITVLCKLHNIPTPRRHIRYHLDIPTSQLIEQYKNGDTIENLGFQYKVSTTYIKARFKDMNFKPRSKKEAQLLRYKKDKLLFCR